MLGLSCVTIAARTVYTAECLHCFRISRTTRLNNAAWRAACNAGVALHQPTRRGCRGGDAHKQRWIMVIKYARPTTPTKPPRGFSWQKWSQRHKSHIRPNEQMGSSNTNIRGALASKLDEIKITKDDFGMDVLAITETWCTSSIPDRSLTLSGFNIYRRYRQDGRQYGGIACYVRSTIPTKHWTEFNKPDLETLLLTIRHPKMPRDHLQFVQCTIHHDQMIGQC